MPNLRHNFTHEVLFFLKYPLFPSPAEHTPVSTPPGTSELFLSGILERLFLFSIKDFGRLSCFMKPDFCCFWYASRARLWRNGVMEAITCCPRHWRSQHTTQSDFCCHGTFSHPQASSGSIIAYFPVFCAFVEKNAGRALDIRPLMKHEFIYCTSGDIAKI